MNNVYTVKLVKDLLGLIMFGIIIRTPFKEYHYDNIESVPLELKEMQVIAITYNERFEEVMFLTT